MMFVIDAGGGGMEQMGRVAKTPLLLQPSTPAADRGGEEVRRPLYRAAVDRLCLLSSSTINDKLKRRRASNQQSTSMATRESNKPHKMPNFN
jgi:hypothetical protein